MASSRRIVYQQGDHVCTLFSSPEEQLSAAIEYIKGGLARGERCLYVCGEHSIRDFRLALRKAGIDVSAEEKRGALVTVTKESAHLKGGSFDPDKMISLLHAAVKDALDAGFTGLCAAGDMSWVLDGAPGSERLVEYEARLNDFYQSNRALGLCQYNRNALPAAILDHCMATHAYVRIEGPILLENPFYEVPQEAMHRKANAEAVPEKLRRFSGGRA
jgi:hypothetical protein